MKLIFAFVFAATAALGEEAFVDEGESVADLGVLVVESDALSKYRAETVSSGTFTSLPPEKLPMVVETLTDDFIREHNPTDLHDLLRYVPGIESGGKSLLVRQPGAFTIRGMGGTEPTMDGVMALGGGMGLFTDTFLLDRVEIAKGPIASLSGGAGNVQNASGAGGSISLFLKSANFEDNAIHLQENSSLGRHTQRHRFMADVNEIFLDDKVAFRILATSDYYEPTYVHQGSQKNARARTSFAVAPSIIFKPNDKLSFGLKTSFQTTDQPSYIGIPVWRGRAAGGYSWYESSSQKGDRSQYDGFFIYPWLTYKVNESWELSFGASMSLTSWSQTTREPYAVMNMASDEFRSFLATGTWLSGEKYMLSNFSSSKSLARNYNVYARSVWSEKIFEKIENTLLVQPDFYWRESTGGFGTPTARYGLTMQDSIEWEWLTILGGVRYDYFKTQAYSTTSATPVRYNSQSANAVSPRGGITIEPIEGLVFFGNLSETRTPTLGFRNQDGSMPSAPWRARQWEGGARVKTAENLWLSIAAYRIKQENVPMADTATNFYTYDGKNTSRGAELSLSGDITPSWSVLAMYSFNKYTDLNVAKGKKGREFARVPQHAFSINTSYRITSGPLSDLVFGGGYRFKSKSYACMRGQFIDENLFFSPSHVFDIYCTIPLSIFGGSDDFTITLGIRNVFNEKYFESSRHYYESLVGEPRTFEIGLNARF